MNLRNYGYKRENIQPGILHIGVGNFHRAHQAFYTDQLLKDDDQSRWGICGVCLLPSDENIVKNLKSQDLNYTLTVCGRNGHDEIYQIGALIELIWAIENPNAVLDKIADSAIKIITLTITEGGYNLDKVTGKFMLKDEKIQHDLQNPTNPTTVFGFVAEGLRRRKAKGNGSITILSCDNLQHNGNTAKNAFSAFMMAQDKELAEWANSNVTFPNSMVDRITPATQPEDIERLNLKSGVNDLAPVYCEDFIQWVIEDNFIAGRPNWERTGVEFTNDVSAFENMKLSLLNASHTLLSYPSLQKGYRKVDEAMQDQQLVKFVRDFMDIDITPHVPAPEKTNLETYKQTLIERFANRSVSDQLGRLCADGISKFPVYVMPNLKKMIGSGQDIKRLAFLIAAYRHYLKYKVDDKGVSFEVTEPWLSHKDELFVASDNPISFLGLSAFKSFDLEQANSFVELYLVFVASIEQNGIGPALSYVVD